jgi:hypothetical protein
VPVFVVEFALRFGSVRFGYSTFAKRIVISQVVTWETDIRQKHGRDVAKDTIGATVFITN